VCRKRHSGASWQSRRKLHERSPGASAFRFSNVGGNDVTRGVAVQIAPAAQGFLMSKITAEFDLVGITPDVITTPDGKRVMIRCEWMAHDPVARHTGKHIHLGMTPVDAMRLLGLLRLAQQRFGWPDHPGAPELIEVPTDRQKN